ncbi:5-formyltetrahydrofolate cyclo-ligase [Parafrankia sp. BMG5.11]|uniref:5-formyltetrahydrofolate cyclo-ligase n=1 Tax=Parafrankia sp. BMG5.11 TaxID=222540 RepID=UPI00103A90AB|nr:5-formyltetrahydrofolate cyclo-ligase [Parafrankia sp. BMG5.11]TCJ39334.1 5-formyltetrahydrofolate cyclo-ligase [Parafrankia sp. BMG5.11]
MTETKAALRKTLRAERRRHVAALPDATRALLFRVPPAPLLTLIPERATVGLYHATANEAPAAAYARFFHERGHPIALPRFSDHAAVMEFAAFADPFGEDGLETGPYGLKQPDPNAEVMVPDVLIVPVVGFSAEGHRLGQGGGHYDRWLAAHPHAIAIGLAWDTQLIDTMPHEPHDRSLAAVVTPTRLYGPFA